jgi:primosomal protein N' (replication factor Y)
MPFVEVIFNLPIKRNFDYKVPEHFKAVLKSGQRVLAPFGHRELTGVITRIREKSEYAECKDIIDILDEKSLISEELLQLTQWISEYYLDYWGQAIQLALPRGIERKSNRIVHVISNADLDTIHLTERQKILFDIIERDPGKSTSIYRKKYGTGAFNYLLNVLKNKNLLAIHQVDRSDMVRTLKRRFVVVRDSIEGDFSGFRKRNELSEILTELAGQSFLFTDFQKKTGYSASKIKRLASESYLAIEERVVDRKIKIEYQEEKTDVILNKEQRHALLEIIKSIDEAKFRVHLLHGVTGSGKTQIYLEAIKSITERGKTAIVLIPEISLTPQTVRRFENYFPGNVAVFHSKMTLGERYDSWMKVYHAKYSIVVGPRSALFMPLKNIGIIVVDEEHDGSYKQGGSSPRYHARDVAIYRAKIHDAIVILGSATPSLESYYNAGENKYNLLELSKRIKNIRLPQVYVVDMKGSNKKDRIAKIFSPLLIDKMKDRLTKNEQIIILQNRRGHSSFLQCTTCGYIALCPNCEISLTYHYYDKHLQCHYCGHSMQAWKMCPKCQSREIKYLGTGTQKIEKEIKSIFTGATIIRMDLDTTTRKGSHDRLLKAFKEGKGDILLGTQMIAKGLDFDNVTLVGVISADIGLTIPDYRASERIFQLLTQVAGRAGRGILKGEVIIQSHLFSHYAIQFASNHDYLGFYKEEISYRKAMVYPPFQRMINIRFTSPDLTKTIQKAREVSQKLKRFSKGLYDIIGPAPCPISKIKNRYRWQVFIKINSQIDPSSRKSKDLIIRRLDTYLRSKRDDIKIEIDVDPVDMM